MSVRGSGTRRAMLSADTGVEAERVQISLWQRMSAGEKLRAACATSASVQELSLAGIRMREPQSTDREQFLRLAALKLGSDRARSVYAHTAPPRPFTTMAMNPVDVALRVAGALESCGVRYVIGGSLASSVSGEPRSTLDVDVMVDITEADVACVLGRLGHDFHADADAFVRAIRQRSSVNVIHLPTAVKVDLFVMGASPVDARQMDRRMKVRLPDRPDAELFVYTPEDILLQKLRWFRMGREASDRQWRDILGIIAVQGELLDRAYVRAGAAELEVSDLLARALRTAG